MPLGFLGSFIFTFTAGVSLITEFELLLDFDDFRLLEEILSSGLRIFILFLILFMLLLELVEIASFSRGLDV